MKMVKVVAIVLALFIFAGSAYAFGGRGKMAERIIKDLGLSSDQAAKFKAQENKMEKEMASHREKMKELSEKLKGSMEKDSPDRNAIHAIIKEIGQNMTEMQIKRADSMLELRSWLTPEQKEKFKKMLERKPHGLMGRPKAK